MPESILVVEDTPNVLELLDVTLRFKGYPVVTARNGQEALEKIARELEIAGKSESRDDARRSLDSLEQWLSSQE